MAMSKAECIELLDKTYGVLSAIEFESIEDSWDDLDDLRHEIGEFLGYELDDE